jgi:alanyl-tRNA synthetase
MPLAEATSLPGVRPVFGEVYPDPVQFVTFGEGTSINFCGGTHVADTNEAEAFVIIEETAVAKGICRISAVTRGLALEAIAKGSKIAAAVAEAEGFPTTTPDLDKKLVP